MEYNRDGKRRVHIELAKGFCVCSHTQPHLNCVAVIMVLLAHDDNLALFVNGEFNEKRLYLRTKGRVFFVKRKRVTHKMHPIFV